MVRRSGGSAQRAGHLAALVALVFGCGGPAPYAGEAARALGSPTPIGATVTPKVEVAQDLFPTRCRSDQDCGYDPSSDRCGSDPRHNRQPPIVDQGILCYCDASREACAMFRVEPTPCEGDHSCAVRMDPRPHPARATRERPHERGKPCRDYTLKTTCERTNICTLWRLECAR